MTNPPDDGLKPVPPPDADSPSASEAAKPSPDRHGVEETAPAFNPLDPESSWMAFLAPPVLELDDVLEAQAVEPSQSTPDRGQRFDPEATAEVFEKQMQALLNEQAAPASAEAPTRDSAQLTEYDPIVPGQSESAVVAGAPPEETASDRAEEPADSAALPLSVERAFEDLTIAEMLGRLRREPGRTLDALMTVLQSEPAERRPRSAHAPKRRPELAAAGAGSSPVVSTSTPVIVSQSLAARPVTSLPSIRDASEEDRAASERGLLRIALLIAAFGLALIGTAIMQTSPIRSEAEALNPGLPWLIAGLVVALIAEWIGGVLRPDQRLDVEVRAEGGAIERRARRAFGGRLTTSLLGAGASALAFILNSDNTFTIAGVIAWLASVLLWVWTFAPQGWTPAAGLRTVGSGLAALGRVRLGNSTFIALVIIMALGAYLRLIDLDRVPGEMTSDHVEFILDAHRALNGQTSVFFA
ncbi:MAG: hypothetical protein NZ518_08290, partial [Dehalococcoidia bacterium]|nr:hypothetical protein [Dehalococcoidia bacterium]